MKFVILLTIMQVHTTFCAIKVSIKDVLIVHNIFKEKCENDKSLLIKDLPNGTVTCKPTVNSFNCYPETIAGNVHKRPCWNVQYDPNVGHEERTCKSDGTWGRTRRFCESRRTKEFLIKRIELLRIGLPHLPNETDPCVVTDNGGCELYCSYHKSFHCSCDIFKTLAKDGKSCIVNKLPNHKGPTNPPHIIPECPNESSGICSLRPDGNYEWSSHPNCFIQCTHGRPSCQCCNPKSLFYSQKCNRCMTTKHPKECPRTVSFPTAKTTPTSKTTKQPIRMCTTAFATSGCKDKTTERYLSYYFDKNSYIVCVRGINGKMVGLCMKCPKGLVWVAVKLKPFHYPTTGYCGYPTN